MQNNNQNGKKTKGFYILLACCVLVIGVSGYVFLSGAAREKKQVEQTGLVAEAQPVQEEPADPTMAQTNEQEKETSTATRKTVMPVSGQVLQDYAMEQLAYNETTRDWRTHDGVDLAAELGEPVKAAADGTVTAVYEGDLYGMTVEVSHADGYTTVYSGLSEEAAVEQGQIVAAGQTIGTVGDTVMVETAMQCHLHFAVKKDGQSVDPAGFLYQ